VRRPRTFRDAGHAGGVEAARGVRSAFAARSGDRPAEQQRDLGRADGPAQISPPAIRLTAARAPLTREIEVRDEFGAARTISIPAERALTVFVDSRELVTLMTLGAEPELLVLGYLRNQRLVERCEEIDSITVDWDVDAAAVKTRSGIARFAEKTAKRVVTTGCGQGTVFGDLMGEIDKIRLPTANDPAARLSQATLYRLLDAVRRQESTYKSAGSVHGCALFRQHEMLIFVEDVGRHNALDTIAGWMWVHGVEGGDKVFYTTGRLTSEMVMKSAQMGVPIVVSRSGITQMGLELGQRLGLALFGRATNRHFICYCGFESFDAEPEPARLG
jgi:FdhD protein